MTLLGDIAKSRARLDRVDQRVRETRARLAGAIRARDEATARGDAAAADAAAQEAGVARDALTGLEQDRVVEMVGLEGARSALLDQTPDPLALADARFPLLLLPVRLEARFAWRDPTDPNRRTFARPGTGSATPLLLVRVLPDDVHVDGHDPALVPEELRWQREFLKRVQAGHDLDHFVAAWEELIARAGPTRAAWIAHSVRRQPPAPTATDRWGVAPRAALLPDRWVARAWVDGQPFEALSELVREPLDVAPDPARAGPGARGLRWLVDFDDAYRAGMALVIPLQPTTGAAPKVQRLLVAGAHVTRDPQASGAALARLLDAHHYTGGLSFVRPGSPTNALPGERPDRTTRPTAREVFDVEGDLWPLTAPATLLDDLPADGWEAAVLLGLDPAVFGHVKGADGRWRQAATDLRRLLAAAVLGPLRRLLEPTVGRDDLELTAQYFVGALDGLGPLPALRVGDQPYGILPVSLLDPSDPDLAPFEQRLIGVLGALRAQVWEPSSTAVPRICGPPADPTTTLLALLRSDGVTRNLALRVVLGPLLADAVLGTLDQRRQQDVAAARQAVIGLLDNLGGQGAQTPLARLLLLGDAAPVRVPLVQPQQPGAGQSAHEYLDLLSFRVPGAAPSLLDLVDERVVRPGALLFALARVALLAAADRASRRLLLEAGVVDEATVAAWDSELDHGPTGPTFLYGLPDRLRAGLPADPLLPIHFLLVSGSPPVGSEPFLDALGAVRSLAVPPATILGRRPARHPPELLEAVLRSELGLLSHRLDAWFTGMATQRLLRLRNTTGRERGVVVGGYGVLLDIAPAPLGNPVPQTELPPGEPGEAFHNAANAGFVHTPSVSHAATAAVLRSAHLAQWRVAAGQAARDAFSIDLSSRRVRTALSLLDGIREGQPLAALLGYGVERLLRAQAPQGIAVVRRAAPLVAGRLTAGGPTEQVAADNVVDAVRLLELTEPGDAAHVGAALGPHFGGLAAADRTAVVTAAVGALADARDALDAVADLLMAEGVFQLVRGNPARAAGGADAISGTGTPPPEPEVVASARSGVAVTQRVAVALPAGGPAPADQPVGWAVTPRATLEPALERWARAVLPAPGTVTVSFAAEPDGPPVLTTTLAALQQAAGDADAVPLRFAALDVVAAAGPDGQGGMHARLVAMARLANPSAKATTVLRTRPPGAAAALAEVLEAAAALRALLLNGRPLGQDDLAPPGTAAAAAAAPDAATGRVDALADTVRVARDTVAAAAQTARGHLEADPPAPDGDLAADRAALLDALLAADALGVGQAVPDLVLRTPAAPAADLAGLVPLARAAAAELDARVAAHDALPAPAAGGSAHAAWAVERARTLLGPTGWLLPALGPPTPGAPEPFEAATPAGATAMAARLVLGRHAAVRAGVARLDRALGVAEALHGAVPAFTVTQRPLAPGETWVAAEPAAGARIPGGRVAMLAHTPFPGEPGPVAALVVDDWTEVVPSTHETTSVAFHYDAPSSAAPNLLLLAVAHPNAEQWSAPGVIAVVEEALALARLRAVDPDTLTGTGQLLPALLSLEQSEPGVGATLGATTLTEPS